MSQSTPAVNADAAAETNAGPPPEVTSADLWGTGALALAFVVCMGLATLFAQPFVDAGLQAFEDPENVGNSIGYILLLLAFTAIILAIAKWGKKWMISVIILGAIGSTVAYVTAPVLMMLGVKGSVAWGTGWGLAALATLALWKHPEWYVIDSVGVVVAAGAAAIFGISLGILPVLVMLVLLAIYDAIAVYKTRHMLALADSVLELRLPVLLVIPKHLGYRFRDEVAKFKEAGPESKPEREALFMGLGDLVMPTILVVSAMHFGNAAAAVEAGTAWGMGPAVGAAVGTLVGFGVLMTFVLRGNPQAGLPLLNGGAIAGFLVGLVVATGSIRFW